jgi:hypothetical protein
MKDVFLLTAESDGQQAVGGLTVTVDQGGLTVISPHGTTAAQFAWPELTVLRTAGRTPAPGGEEAVLLEVSGPGRTHRFAVPTDDPVVLETTIAGITGIPAPETPRKKSRKRK